MQPVKSNLPVGWRFRPTNEELLDHYLKNKRLGLPIDGSDIQELQVFNFDPWDLLDNKSPYEEKYFFCRREFLVRNGQIRRKRKAETGFWKRTGKPQSVTLEDGDEKIATRRIFVFHDPKRTKWVIHEYEYTAQLSSPVEGDFVLCKLMINKKTKDCKESKKIEPDFGKEKPKKKRKNIRVHQKTESNKKRRKDWSKCNTNGQYQNLLKRKAFSACVDGEPSNHMTPDSENQTPGTDTAVSTYEEGQSSYSKTTHQITTLSVHDKTEANSLCPVPKKFSPSDSEHTNLLDVGPSVTNLETPNSEFEIDPLSTDLSALSGTKNSSLENFDPLTDLQILSVPDFAISCEIDHSHTEVSILSLVDPSSRKFSVPSDIKDTDQPCVDSSANLQILSNSESAMPTKIDPLSTDFPNLSDTENINFEENLQNPPNSEFTSQIPSNPESVTQVPASPEFALQVPPSPEFALQVPPSPEFALQVPSNSEFALQVPSNSDFALQIPSNSEFAPRIPDTKITNFQNNFPNSSKPEFALEVLPNLEFALQVPSNSEFALQIPDIKIKTFRNNFQKFSIPEFGLHISSKSEFATLSDKRNTKLQDKFQNLSNSKLSLQNPSNSEFEMRNASNSVFALQNPSNSGFAMAYEIDRVSTDTPISSAIHLANLSVSSNSDFVMPDEMDLTNLKIPSSLEFAISSNSELARLYEVDSYSFVDDWFNSL